MGHSGGTFIGIQAAARAPELYHAYIGVAQMSNQLESERLAYDYMLQRFKDDGNAKMVRRLEEAPVGDSVPLPDCVPQGSRRGHARPGHRHDPRHEVDRHRAAAARPS